VNDVSIKPNAGTTANHTSPITEANLLIFDTFMIDH